MASIVDQFAGIAQIGAPLILAATGETFTERAGVINLSLDGSLALSALAGFVVGVTAQSLLLGILAAMAVGAAIALLIVVSSIELKQSQVAVGFILTLFCRDLAIFLGTPYRGATGLDIPYFPIPILRDIPIIGKIFFSQDLFTYLSFIAIIGAWFWIFRTKPGLTMRSVGERPATAFARGTNVNRIRYLYTALGGAMVGLAGAAYTLGLTSKWAESDLVGRGWIALAIVIFGGWHPFRIALGVYLVVGLEKVTLGLQGYNIPTSLLNAIPWILMVLTLLAVSGPYLEFLLKILPPRFHPVIRTVLRSKPPAALGTTFTQEGE